LIHHLEQEINELDDPRAQSELHLRIGQIWEDRHLEKAKAVLHYQQAFKLDQASTTALRSARRVYREMGKPRMIAQLANLELKLLVDPQGTDKEAARGLYFELGEALTDLGEFDKALQCYKRVLSIFSEDEHALANFEDLEIESGWDERALSLADNALAIADRNPVSASRMFLRAARLLQRFDKSNPQIEEYLINSTRLDPENESAINLIENLLENDGRRAQIPSFHDDVILGAPDEATAAQRAVRIGSRWAVKFEDRETAAGYLELALENDASLESAFNMLNGHYRAAGKLARIVALAETALERRVSDDVAESMLQQSAVILWRDLEDIANAERHMMRLAKICPNHPLVEEFERWSTGKNGGETQEQAPGTETSPIHSTIPSEEKIEEVFELTAEAAVSHVPSDPGEEHMGDIRETGEESLEAGSGGEEPERGSVPEDEPQVQAAAEDDSAGCAPLAAVDLTPADAILVANSPPAVPEPVATEPPQRSNEPPPEVLEAIAAAREAERASPARGVEAWRKVLKLDPGCLVAIDALLTLFEQMNRWPDYVKTLRSKADLVPEIQEQVRLNLEVAQLFIERFSNLSEAIKAYERVHELDPTNRVALERLRDMYERRKDWERLIAVMATEAETIEEKVEKLERYVEIALLAEQRVKKPASCIELWEKVRSVDPDHAQALASLASFYERNKEFDKLVEILSRQAEFLDQRSERINVLTKLGTICGDKLGDSARAVQAWRGLLEIDPEDRRAQEQLKKHYLAMQAWQELEEFYARSAKWDEFIRVLEREAVRDDLDNEIKITLQFRLAQLWTEHKQRVDKASRAYEQILEMAPTNLEAAEALIPIYEESDDAANLARVCEVKLGHLSDVESRLELQRTIAGLYEGKLHDTARGFGWYADSIRTSPSFELGWDDLERTAGAASRWPDVVALFREIQGSVDRPTELSLRLARVLDEELGHAEEALECYASVLEAEPTNDSAIQGLIKLYGQLARYPELLAVYDRRFELTEDAGERKRILYERAAIQEDQIQDPLAAIETYKAVLDLAGEEEDALGALDRLYESQNNWPALAEVLERELALGMDHNRVVELKFRLGGVRESALENTAGAVECYREILTVQPAHDGARQALEAMLEGQTDLQPEIARILDPIYEATAEWEKLIGVLEILLRTTEAAEEQVAILMRIGAIFANNLQHHEAAFDAYSRAVRVAPSTDEARHQLFQLASIMDWWVQLADLIDWAARQVEDPALARELWIAVAKTRWEQLEDAEAAVNAYHQVLHIDSQDQESIEALEAIFTRVEKWPELIDILRRKAEMTSDFIEKRALFGQMASIYDEMLNLPEDAAACYREILAIDGTDVDSLRSLDTLYQRQEQWGNLADNLEQQLALAEDENGIVRLQLRLAALRESRMEQVESAIEIYREVLRRAPANVEALQALERLISIEAHKLVIAEILEPIYSDTGEWQRLIDVIDIMIGAEEDPRRRVELQHRVAELYETQGDDPDRAFDRYSIALTDDPTDSETLRNLERLARNLAAYDSLAKVYEQQAAQAHDLPDLAADFHAKVAVICSDHLQDAERAITHWRNVLGLDPGNIPAANALIRLYQLTERYLDLAEILVVKTEFISDLEDKKRHLFQAGEIYEVHLEDNDASVRVYHQILDLDVDDFEALDKLESLYLRLERWANLQTIYQRKADLVGSVEQKKEILYVMGAVYEREVNDVERAIDTYQRVLELDPDDLQALQRLDALYQASEQWQELRDVLEHEAELVSSPDEVIGFKFRIGSLWEHHLGESARAVDMYREILDVFPEHPESIAALERILRGATEPLLAAETLERLYEAAGEWRKLIDVLEVKLSHTDPDETWERVRLLHQIAVLYESVERLDSPEEAFGVYARALAADPGQEETLSALERLAEFTGKWADLAQLYDPQLQAAQDPERIIDLGLRVAVIYEERLGQAEEAIERHVKVLEHDPENRKALTSLDRLYQITERWEALVDILKRESLIAISPEDALDFQYRFGQVLQLELGKIDEAIECYRDILGAAPEHTSTLHALEKLFADGLKRAEIAEILDPLYRVAAQWDRLVAINEALLEGIADDFERVALIQRVAELYETKLLDEVSAFNWFGRAIQEAPNDEHSLAEFERLAAATGGWRDAVDIYNSVFMAKDDGDTKKAVALRMARIYEEELGDVQNAEQTYRVVLGIDEYETTALEALDRIYLADVEWDKLVGIIARRVEVSVTDDERVDHCFRLGKVHEEQRDDVGAAEKCFRRIIEDFDPQHGPSLDSLESIYFVQCNWQQLYGIFERKLDIAPSDTARADLYSKMAVTAADALDQVELGIELWSRVLDIVGEDPVALGAMAGLYARLEKWHELVDILERQAQIAEDPDTRAGIYQELGVVWGSRLGEDRNALENWERVLDISPGNLPAFRALVDIHSKNEAWHELVDTTLRMLDTAAMEMEESELKACHRRLGVLYAEKLQQYFDAIESWNKVRDVDPDDMEAIDALDVLYTQEERWEDCVAILDRKAVLTADVARRIEILLRVASIWEEQIFEPAKALSAYERIIEVDPLHERAFASLEKLYSDEMTWEKLVHLYLGRLGQEQTQHDERIDLYRRIAKVYEESLGNADNAFLVMLKAFEEDYTNDQTAAELERLAASAGKWTDLLNACNQVLQSVQDRAIQLSLLVKIGRWYAELDHAEYAITYFNQALKIDPAHTGALAAMAGIYRNLGQWDMLAQVLTRQVEVSTDGEERKDIFFALGELYENKLAKNEQAVAAYRAALAIDPQMIDALDALQRLFGNMQSWSDLIGVLRQKIQATEDPETTIDLQQQVGQIYEIRLEDSANAVEAYRAVLERDASYMPALKALEGLFSREERWQDLLDILEMQLEVVTSERERISLLLRMAQMLEQEFVKPERAAERLEAVLDIDPVNEPALTGLQRLYRQNRKWQELVDTLFKHIEATPDRDARVALYQEVAKVYSEELDDPHSAIDALKNVLDVAPNNIPALEQLGAHLQRVENWVESNEVLSRLARVVPEPEKRVELSYRLGALLAEHLGDLSAAMEQYQNALDIEPGHLPSLGALRAIYVEQLDWVGAARMLDQEQQYTPQERQRSVLLCELGRVHAEHLDDQPKANECYEGALTCDGENVKAALPLVEVYAAAGRWDAAEPLLDMLVRKAPTFKPEPAQLQRLQFLLGEAAARLEHDDKALKAYKAAYDVDATHLPTLRGIAYLYFKKAEWDKAFKFYQMILVHHRDAQSSEEIVDIFYRLGVIKLEVGERRKALNMFDKALEIDVNHRLTLEAVVGMHEKAGDWEKVIHYKKAIIGTSSADERFELLLQIGDIWQDKLKNSQKAIQSYTEALEIQPENHVLLHKLLNLFTATEQWQQAVDVIGRVASLEKNDKSVSKYHYSIALVYRDKIKDPNKAIDHFNEALDRDSTQLKAFESIDRILTLQKDWKTLERNYRKMLHRITGQGRTEIEVNLWHFLGEIYRTRMGNFSAAADAFRAASKLDKDNLDRHKILAELYMMIPDQWENAVEEHQYLIRENPYRVDSYKALRKIYFDTRQYDKAWCLCATLSFLKKADAEEQQFFDQYKTKGMIRAQARLDNERWIKDLFHTDEDLYIGKIFETILPFVRRFKIQPQKAFGLKKKDRHDPMTSTITFAKTFAYVAQVINLPVLPELYLRPDQAMGLNYAITEPPASVVGQLLLSGFTPQDLTFEIGRHLAYYRGEHYIRWVEPTTAGLRILLLSAVKAVNPQFKTPPDPSGVLDQTVATLASSLTPAAKEQLGGLVRKFIQKTGEADIKKWINAVEMTACRCGFLLCNDIQSAARMIQNQAATVGDVPAKEKIKELVLFSVSEQYFKLRQALGVTIGQ
jgi:tetratricopeptide (TPR) repeat protein